MSLSASRRLTDIDAQELIRSVKAVKLLEGARGMIPAQMDKVEDTLLRISQLADQHRFVKELDINPLMVSDKDANPSLLMPASLSTWMP